MRLEALNLTKHKVGDHVFSLTSEHGVMEGHEELIDQGVITSIVVEGDVVFVSTQLDHDLPFDKEDDKPIAIWDGTPTLLIHLFLQAED